MTKFTKEQLQEIAETDHVQCGDASALARQLLAGMEQEPVYFINKVTYSDVYGDDVELKAYCSELDAMKSKADFGGTVIQLYAAPQLPQPAVVPDAIEPTFDAIKSVLPTANPDEYACCVGADMWNACRAAMLQGSDPVSQPYTLRDGVAAIRSLGGIDAGKIQAERDALNEPTCWCHTCRPVTVADMRFVVCPECGNKRCPHANDHRNACTGSNEPGQQGSAYPAAPQQEVKSALEKGMTRYGDAMQKLSDGGD